MCGPMILLKNNNNKWYINVVTKKWRAVVRSTDQNVLVQEQSKMSNSL